MGQINPALKALAVAAKSLAEDPRNVRRHSDRNVIVVRESLEKFGQQKPIVALLDGTIIAGNGTFRASQLEDAAKGWKPWTELAVVKFDKAEDAARAYALVDNRSAELAEWDYPELGAALQELQATFNLEGLGWDPSEAATLLAADWTPRDSEPGALGDESTAQPYRVTPDQRAIIDRAIAVVRAQNGDDMSDGRCLELIAADWLTDPNNAEVALETGDDSTSR